MNRKPYASENVQNARRKASPPSRIDERMLLYGDKLNKESIMLLKQRAAEKTRMIERRKKAVLVIQSIWKGILFRRKFRKIKPKLMIKARQRIEKMKKLEFIRQHAEEIICDAIYDRVLKKRAEQKELLRKYVDHCAVMIQKTWKGYSVRREYQIEIHNQRRIKYLLTAAVKGWKTRKCWNNKSMVYQRKELAELQTIHDAMEPDERDDFQAPRKKFYRKVRQRKIQVALFFDQIYFGGRWMEVQGGHSRSNSVGRERNKGDHDVTINSQNDRRIPRDIGRRRRTRSSVSGDEVIEDSYIEDRERQNGDERPLDRDYEEEPYERNNHDQDEEENEYDNNNKSQSLNQSRRPLNAFEERENIPVGGSRMNGMNAYEARENMPIGGAAARQNAYEERDNMPIRGVKSGNQMFSEAEEDENAKDKEEGTENNLNQKRQFLKKKAKYDPRKAIEDAKKKQNEEEDEDALKKNKSEEFRDMIKAARNYNKEAPTTQKKQPPKKRGANINDSNHEEKDHLEPKEEKANADESKEKEGRSFTFLKRKSKNPGFHKLNWKVNKRIDCWTQKDNNDHSRSLSPHRDGTKSPKAETSVRGRANTSGQEGVKAQPSIKQAKSPAARVDSGMNAVKKSPKEQQRPQTAQPQIQQVKPAAGAKKPAQQQQKSQPSIKILELEKAFKTNFSSKYTAIVQPFFAKGSVRDPNSEAKTSIPIINLESTFVTAFDISKYQILIQNLDKQYKQLQMIT